MLTDIDLNSLEEIRGYEVAVNNNPNLCFIGDLSRLVVNTEFPNCIVAARRDKVQCSKLML